MSTHDPSSRPGDREARAQAEAERAERAGLPSGGDARIDGYRLVVRALRQPLAQQLPADFASRVAAIAERRGGGEGFEEWLVVLLMLAMGIGGLLFVGPILVNVFHAVADVVPSHLPWRQLVLGALGIGVVAAVERGWMRLHPAGPHFR